jgi:hypothetical protein
MKRSELVKQICILIEEQASQGTAYMFKSEQLVQLIEEAGMLPPLNERRVKRLPYEDVENSLLAYEWESE